MTLPNKVAQFNADSNTVNAWLNGPATGTGSTLTTAGGTLRTPAKLIADKDADINVAANGVLTQTVTASVVATTAQVTATAQAVVSTTSSVTAMAQQVSATNAKVRAEAARDAALIQAGVYVDEPTGRAAVANGVAFKVQGSGDTAAIEYRRIDAFNSALIATYPSANAIRRVRAKTTGGQRTANLLDKETVTNGAFINSYGVAESNAAWCYSDFIAVTASTAYVTSKTQFVSFYDAGFTFISTIAFVTGFTTPANAVNVRLSQLITDLPGQQLEAGAVRTGVFPFGSFVEPVLVNRASVAKEKLDFSPIIGTASKNLYDKSAVTVGVFPEQSSGILQPNAGFAASDFIAVTPNSIYSRKTVGNQLAFYGTDKTYVSGISSVSGAFTAPANAYWVRLSNKLEQMDVEQLELGSASTGYAPFAATIPPSRMPFAAVIGVLSKNLFNKNAVKLGYFANISTGDFAAQATFSVSEAIATTPGMVLTSSETMLAAFYGANGEIIGGNNYSKQVTAPAGAAWVRISNPTAVNETQQLEQGAVSTVYSPFGLKVPYSTLLKLPGQTDYPFLWLLPADIYLVSGESFSVYYNNIIKYSQSFRKGCYHVATRIVSGSAPGTLDRYDYKWSYTPAASEVFAVEFLIIETFTDAIVASKIVTMHCANSALSTNRGRTANIIALGDSFADYYGVTSYLYDFVTMNGGVNGINMMGTQTTDRTGVKDEAYAGWSYNLFTTMAGSGGRTNPFWNTGTSQFDFAFYVAANYPAYTPHSGAGPYIDAVVSFLGINDVGGQFANPAASVQKIIDSIHAWDPAIKVLLHTTTCPPVADKFATNNFALGNYEQWKFRQEKWNEMMLAFEISASKVWVIPTAAHFDTRNAIISAALTPDKFTPSYTEIQTVDIHPTASGAKYIADAMFQAIYSIVLR